MAITEHDELIYWRCPPLGGEVPFKHCRTMNGGLPCGKLSDCWGKRVDVEHFLASNYSHEELERMFAPTPDRLNRILQVLESLRLKPPESDI